MWVGESGCWHKQLTQEPIRCIPPLAPDTIQGPSNLTCTNIARLIWVGRKLVRLCIHPTFHLFVEMTEEGLKGKFPSCKEIHMPCKMGVGQAVWDIVPLKNCRCNLPRGVLEVCKLLGIVGGSRAMRQVECNAALSSRLTCHAQEMTKLTFLSCQVDSGIPPPFWSWRPGELDGVDAPICVGKGAIHPSKQAGGESGA